MKKNKVLPPPKNFIELLENLVQNKILEKNGSDYVKHSQRRIQTISLESYKFSIMEQERYRPSEWYKSEFIYSDSSLNMLKIVFGN